MASHRVSGAPSDASERRAVPAVLVYDPACLPTSAATFGVEEVELSPLSRLRVPPRNARALEVPAGSAFRIVCVDGPQVGDLNLWNAHDLSERFFSGKTRALHGTHVGCGDSL